MDTRPQFDNQPQQQDRDAISPDVSKGKPLTECKDCGKPLHLGDTCARVLFGVICEACADELNKCPHESGHVTQHYDEDGCRFHVWSCDNCALQTFDQE